LSESPPRLQPPAAAEVTISTATIQVRFMASTYTRAYARRHAFAAARA
jgi:hypothetical protein